MIGENSLAELFASETLVALLRVLLLRADESFYQRELADASGARLYLVQRELGRLERTGLISKTARGNRVYYQVNRGHPALEDLKRVFLKTIALGDALRSAVSPLSNRVQVAFVYGSYASGQERAASDLDLFLIGELTSREAAAVLGPVGRDLGRELNTAVYPPAEFRRKAREGNHFIAEMLKGPKVFLIGDEHALAELAG
ncbi:MAG: nucleotidyltransferase domain-containing protein [Armatimonadota bacterium]|jgi:predicted nucleotidyltransferase